MPQPRQRTRDTRAKAAPAAKADPKNPGKDLSSPTERRRSIPKGEEREKQKGMGNGTLGVIPQVQA